MTPRLLRPLAVAACVAMALTALCNDFTVHDIAVDVLVERDGSARVTEVIDLTHDAQGETLILSKGNLGVMTISDLKVSDDNGNTYVERPSDKVSGSSHECGIEVSSDGTSLIWSAGANGRHKYTLNYKLSNLVRLAIDGHAQMNHYFINYIDNDIEHTVITVRHADGLLRHDYDMLSAKCIGASSDYDIDDNYNVTVECPKALRANRRLGVKIVYDASVFADLEPLAVTTEIAPTELSSGMMTTTEPEAYSEGWLTKIWDFLLDHLLLGLIGIAALIWAVSFVIRKLIKLVP